jgi:hypothetical protein
MHLTDDYLLITADQKKIRIWDLRAPNYKQESEVVKLIPEI